MKVDYITHSGDDLLVVNAARVSFSKESDWDWTDGYDENGPYQTYTLSEKDKKLIKYLASYGHWTPFAHPQITLRMKAPIFVRTQCFKHKQGFVENEVSRRYVDDTPEFFFPILRQRNENAKQGSRDEFPVNLEACENIIRFSEGIALEVYNKLLEENVAPEQARMVLPQSMYTEWYWTGSLAAYARFYKQRIDPHAQKEIQELAKLVGDIIQPLFPVSWEALTE